MFIIFLRFSTQKADAPAHMQEHKDWIQAGFDAGIFLLSGSLSPNQGGAILAHNTSLAALEGRVAQDPFVIHNIVQAEIAEIAPAKSVANLEFLISGKGKP